MVLHGMQIRVKEALSQPNESDKQIECRYHGGVEAVESSVTAAYIHDEFQLLRMRHRLIHRPTPEFWASTAREVDKELDEDARSLSVDTPKGSLDDGPPIFTYGDTQAIERQLHSLGLDRFEGDYIELDAGVHEDFLQEVVDNMKTSGHFLKSLVDDFANRAVVYRHLEPKMQVQEPIVKLANTLAEHFFAHLPGSWEDDDGETHQYTEAGEVFSSRGLTYVKQDMSDEGVLDGPKPALLPVDNGTILGVHVARDVWGKDEVLSDPT
jgi:hypothetical protein